MSRFIDNWSFNSTQLCVSVWEEHTLRLTRTRVSTPATFFQTFCVLFSNIQDEAQQKRWESFTDARVLCRVNAECRVSVWMVFWCLITLPICTSVIVAWFSVWTRETQMCFWFSPFKMQLIHAFDFFFIHLNSFLKGLSNLSSFIDLDAFVTLYHCGLMTSSRVCLFGESLFFARLRPRLFIRVCKRTFVWSFLYSVWNLSVF